MDLSNRESAAYWYRVAAAETDPDLRKQALATHRKFLKMAQREERRRLWLQDPGHGMRSMLGWVVLITLIVLVVILCLSKAFPLTAVYTVFTFVLGVLIVAAAVSMRVYGHISQKTMLEMIRLGLKTRPSLENHTSEVEIVAGLDDGVSHAPQLRPPAEAPSISFDNDDE
jgi:TRAP-type uncharacterized transport system fused permease subunit